MKLLVYKTVKEFWKENENLLLERETVTQLININALRNLDKNICGDCLFGVVQDEFCKTIMIFVHVAPFNIVIYNSSGKVNKSAIYALVDYLIKEGISFRGANGNKETVDVFNEYYKEKTGWSMEEHFSMDIMELRKVKENKLVPGYFRKATLDDLELLTKWAILMGLEIDNTKITYEEGRENEKLRIEEGNVFIYENEHHEPVSTAFSMRKLLHGIAIGGVYTPKEQRLKGYSTACIDHISRYLLEAGNEYVSLFVEKKNPFSNSVYKKVGYVVLEEDYDYRLKF